MSGADELLKVRSPALTVRWARQLLVAIHIPILLSPIVFTLLYVPSARTVHGVVWLVALTIGVGAIQVRHSLATARGVPPRGGRWSLAAMALLVYVPMPWFGLNWGIGQTSLIASTLMVLGRRVGAAATAAVLVTATILTGQVYWGLGSLARFGFDVGGAIVFDGVVGVSLYAAARLVRVLAELDSARGELADLAVSRERLRVSRDLHDLLGQSLATVSLKGELALRLLPRQSTAAREELAELTAAAVDAKQGVHAIAEDSLTLSLPSEIDNATALLHAAGIASRVTIDVTTAPMKVQCMLAWAVREGVTNVLRHSSATTCSIVVGEDSASVWLEIVNDGASAAAGNGSGLAGLAERVRTLHGSLSACPLPDGAFRLFVQVPRGETT